MLKKKIFFLIGPTAIGKTLIAIHLAKKINAEIISCDSMQVYSSMDIVTSQPAYAQRKKVKHHLLGVINPAKEYNVSRYRKDALSICSQLFSKGKIPLFVGGSGLYYSIVIDGLFPAAPEDKLIRAKLYKQLSLKGNRYLYEKLAKIDPLSARRIHPNDSRRIIRSLEVYMKTGMPLSVLQKGRVGLGAGYEIKILALNMDRQALYNKIDQRVSKMFRAGLIKEVSRLLKHKLSRTAKCAIGIRELEGYFNGEYSLKEAKRLIQRNSRHYAKRQLTWFRRDKRIQWIVIKDKETHREVARRIWKKLS
ncbi:MAG: tRNA (adenosine(37)-N6)-dimethylallyltransferase MiaA [Candidatus Omnitrophica bacterium]|jgi:tRNA dimethylallyltransferase|nr:tRNA (adenosine(37)-N6)-dimethylallyltransferase MiaA [Candidatus Omnitrophota bacterium]MDD5690695.1 tRNA (adenosine(37)-N6)-dimethylallyltransferase MiaA [Candidatus Omnitrophota bacterium]